MSKNNFLTIALVLTFIIFSIAIAYSLPKVEGEVMIGEHRYHQFLDHQGHVNALVHDPNCQCFGGR